jgi:hypothetical protein
MPAVWVNYFSAAINLICICIWAFPWVQDRWHRWRLLSRTADEYVRGYDDGYEAAARVVAQCLAERQRESAPLSHDE